MAQEKRGSRGPQALAGEDRRRHVKTKFVNVPVSEELYELIERDAVPPLSRARVARRILEEKYGLASSAA